ncbi:hypothetical protein V8C86DRAFT_2517895 [Haematococcus lacustris]
MGRPGRPSRHSHPLLTCDPVAVQCPRVGWGRGTGDGIGNEGHSAPLFTPSPAPLNTPLYFTQAEQCKASPWAGLPPVPVGDRHAPALVRNLSDPNCALLEHLSSPAPPASIFKPPAARRRNRLEKLNDFLDASMALQQRVCASWVEEQRQLQRGMNLNVISTIGLEGTPGKLPCTPCQLGLSRYAPPTSATTLVSSGQLGSAHHHASLASTIPQEQRHRGALLMSPTSALLASLTVNTLSPDPLHGGSCPATQLLSPTALGLDSLLPHHASSGCELDDQDGVCDGSNRSQRHSLRSSSPPPPFAPLSPEAGPLPSTAQCLSLLEPSLGLGQGVACSQGGFGGCSPGRAANQHPAGLSNPGHQLPTAPQPSLTRSSSLVFNDSLLPPLRRQSSSNIQDLLPTHPTAHSQQQQQHFYVRSEADRQQHIQYGALEQAAAVPPMPRAIAPSQRQAGMSRCSSSGQMQARLPASNMLDRGQGRGQLRLPSPGLDLSDPPGGPTPLPAPSSRLVLPGRNAGSQMRGTSGLTLPAQQQQPLGLGWGAGLAPRQVGVKVEDGMAAPLALPGHKARPVQPQSALGISHRPLEHAEAPPSPLTHFMMLGLPSTLQDSLLPTQPQPAQQSRQPHLPLRSNRARYEPSTQRGAVPGKLQHSDALDMADHCALPWPDLSMLDMDGSMLDDLGLHALAHVHGPLGDDCQSQSAHGLRQLGKSKRQQL